MKKTISVLFLTFCLFSSCMPTFNEVSRTVSSSEASFSLPSTTSLLLDPQFDTKEFLPDFDFHNEFGKWKQMCESDQAYYLFSSNNSFLHYYDKQSGLSGILCGKPECSHSDISCNAYLAGGGDLMFYDGYIYWVQQGNSLLRINPDGTERENVQSLQGGVSSSVFLHRGYIYCIQSVSSVIDGESQNIIRLTQQVLGDAEQAPVTIVETIGKDYYYQAAGNTIYLVVQDYTRSDDSAVISSTVLLYSYDSASGTLALLAQDAIENNYLIHDMRYIDGILYFSACDSQYQSSSLSQYDPDSKSIIQLLQLDVPMMLPEIGPNYILYGAGREHPAYHIVDFEGNLIREGELLEGMDIPGDWTYETKMLAEDQILILLNDFRFELEDSLKNPSRVMQVPLDPSEPVCSMLTIEPRMQ